MYFALVQKIDSRLWAQAVQRAAQECSFFPTPASLREYASAILLDEAKREVARNQTAKALPDPRDRVTFLQGHPDLPKNAGEGFLEYLERLSIFLGYKTGANQDDPRATEDLAARMRADAERAEPSPYWESR